MSLSFRTTIVALSISLCDEAFAAQPIPPDPIYIVIENGYKGIFIRKNEYLEYSIIGKDAKPYDAYRIQVKSSPFLGVMVTFADERSFPRGGGILERHKIWEIQHWQSKAKKVETIERTDLVRDRQNIKVTKFNITGQSQGDRQSAYIVSVATRDGVYAFSIGPSENADDEFLNQFVGSVKLNDGQFDPVKESAKARAGESVEDKK